MSPLTFIFISKQKGISIIIYRKSLPLPVIPGQLSELPVGYKVTKASRHNLEEPVPMVKEAKQNHFQTIEILAGDKAYDSGPELEMLYDTHGIKPVIDIRNRWKDGEQTKALAAEVIDNVVYDYRGTVFCHCPESNEWYEMTFWGFEKDRKTLKYKCPAAALPRMKCCSNPKDKSIRLLPPSAAVLPL